jgi:dTDP-4-amino-4,6-dideoxygalactose transaminase
MSERGIGTEIYYPVPMHHQECFAQMRFNRDNLGETEAACREVLNLPMFPSLTADEQSRVVESIRSFYSATARMAA